MSRILITSGPTRQYLDPVRYLSNASSGRMGQALAEAAVARGHDVVVVSGPVSVQYPSAAEVLSVVTTEEMLEVSRQAFDHCDGLIGVAAPCDFRPVQVEPQKISKTGQPLVLELHETPDIVATLGAEKGSRWVVGFALETQDRHLRAIVKVERKRCDLMVVNGPQAMDSEMNKVEVMDRHGHVILRTAGRKHYVATGIFQVIQQQLIDGQRARPSRAPGGRPTANIHV